VSLTAVGSIAFDSVSSPFGADERQLGGSAVYSSLAAAFFTDVLIVGPVGGDFGEEHYALLETAGIETSAIQQFPRARTFFWRGRYEFDMSVAHTEETQLNVFDGWHPRLSRSARDSDVLFLAAMDPEVQLDIHEQWSGKRWAALDTIDYWIEHSREKLIEAIERVDIVLMNDLEARELTGEPLLLRAARTLMSAGPRAVVLRLGQYGCALLTRDAFYSLPSYPLAEAVDPTGCGDAFAGGFLGYLAIAHAEELTEEVLRRAATYGSVMASYCQEEFGPARLARLSDREVGYRFEDFRATTHFAHVPTAPRPREDDGQRIERETRLERPAPTPSTVGLRAPHRTPSTETPPAPHRTPSTERLVPTHHPLPPHAA
jgi:sugar/nucleoside kinase (ribokinase family)